MHYRLSTPFGDVDVTLDVTDGNQRVAIVYHGEAEGVGMVRDWLSRQYGAFGHGIGDATTAIDLHLAMQHEQASMFAPELISGEELVASYEPAVRDDAVT